MKTPREKVEFYLALPVTSFRSLDPQGKYHCEVIEWPGCQAKGDSLAEAELILEQKKRAYVQERLDKGMHIHKPHGSADVERMYNTLKSIFINIALDTFTDLGIDTDKIPGAISLEDIISGGIKLAIAEKPKTQTVHVNVDTKPVVENLEKKIAELAAGKKMPDAPVVDELPANVVEPEDEENYSPEPTDAPEPTEDAATAFPVDEPPAPETKIGEINMPTTEPEHGIRSEFYDTMPPDMKALEDRRCSNGISALSSDEKLKLRKWKQAESARRRRAAASRS